MICLLLNLKNAYLNIDNIRFENPIPNDISAYEILKFKSNHWGGSNPIFPHPQILISMCLGQKWGKKYMEREGKSIRFSKLLILYNHYFRHINYLTRFFVQDFA